jgi:hypothetical protein
MDFNIGYSTELQEILWWHFLFHISLFYCIIILNNNNTKSILLLLYIWCTQHKICQVFVISFPKRKSIRKFSPGIQCMLITVLQLLIILFNRICATSWIKTVMLRERITETTPWYHLNLRFQHHFVLQSSILDTMNASVL